MGLMALHARRPPSPLPIARQQDLAADLLGLANPRWEPLTEGTTAAVYRAVGHSIVVRFSRTPARVRALQAHLARAAALVAHGVPFAFPALAEPLLFTDPALDDSPAAAATVWHDLGESQPIDYEALGHALRLLHDNGSTALAGDEALGVVSDFDHMRLRLDRAARQSVLAVEEHDALGSWVDRMEASHPGHPMHASHRGPDGTSPADGGAVLVHDDVWPKNVIQHLHGAHLLDPDNLAWGTREHDLAFITRAQDNGTITFDDLLQFERGYGQQCPSPDIAWEHAYVHRIGWVLDLIESRHLSEPQRMLNIELPLWSLPRGPRDHPSL